MDIFIEIGIVLAIVTLTTFVTRLLKQPLVVGYILSGIIAGPYVLNLITDTEYVELFSKLGIAILLFIVGLNLKPDVIRDVGKVALFTGLGQIIITSAVGFGIMLLLGFSYIPALYGAIALTFSSTIIILKLLGDKGDLKKLYGKISVGFLLVQDVVATIILLLISVWGSNEKSTSIGLDMVLLLAKGFLAFYVLYIVNKYLLPKISKFLSTSQEHLFIFALTWGLGIAAIFHQFHFSIEIGALIAGVILSSSIFSQEIISKMKPLQDFFILQFFVLLGSQIILSEISTIILPAILLSLFVLIGNPIIVLLIMNAMGYKSHTGFLAGLTVAQISEFSLILMALGLSFGHVDSTTVSLITLVGIITISGSTYLILYSDKIYHKLKNFLQILEFKKPTVHEGNTEDEDYNMIIFGYDRVGYDFMHMAQKIETKFLIVDYNPEAIHKLEKSKAPFRFGDAGDIDFLEEINMKKAKAVVSTIPDFKTNIHLVSYYRNHSKDGIIIVTAHDIHESKELYSLGASLVIMPHYLGATFASQMIESFGLNPNAFNEEKERHLKYLEHRAKITG